MVLSLRRRANKSTTSSTIAPRDDYPEMADIVIPAHFRCPISLDLMKDPVTLSTGMTYDRDSIEKWIESGNRTCPVTNQVLNCIDLIPNHTIRRMIQDWCVLNRSHGIDRIPTPRIPVTATEVSSVCDRIIDAAKRKDAKKCRELVCKIKTWAKDSERNRACIAKSRAGFALCWSFESFCAVSPEDVLLEEILSILAWALGSVDVEGQASLGNDKSLRRLVSFLLGNDLSSRQNAVSVIKVLLSSEQGAKVAESLVAIEGTVTGLVRMVKEPVCPRATKASLTAIFYVIKNDSDTYAKLFLELGLVSLLLEVIFESVERGVCERAIRVLDVISDSEEGREMARANAMTVPLLVKRMLRVSDLATEHLVSVLWKIVAMRSNVDDILVALEVGAFEKMLVMLQIGCGTRLKEKVTELLKIFNLHRSRLDCVDPLSNFKYLKRSL